MLARAVDSWWVRLGRPDPFFVIEAGAGRGTLARSILAAVPECRAALRYVLVERATPLRAAHATGLSLEPPSSAFAGAGPEGDDDEGAVAASAGRGAGPLVVSVAEPPRLRVDGVVLANELLDNLAFGLVERTAGGWSEVRVGADGGALVEVLVPSRSVGAATAAAYAPDAATGARVPVQAAAGQWLAAAASWLERGRIVVFDYASTTPLLAARPWREWLRTYRGHERGSDPLDGPGTQDITCEVAVDQLARVRPLSTESSQAAFLATHGIDQLVEQGRAVWRQRAHLGDLEALRARSRVREAEALTDPTGLGAFRVLEWEIDS